MFKFIAAIIVVLSLGALFLSINHKISADEKMLAPSGSNIADTIVIEQNRFIPTLTTINRGQEVVFSNKDTQAYTLVPDAISGVRPEINIGEIKPDQSVAVTFDNPGTFGFHDVLHPETSGKVVVE